MTAIILVNKKKQILMMNRRAFPFSWSLVMGHIHNGESLKTAAQRELVEETGIASNKLSYLFTTTADNPCDIGVDKHTIAAFKFLVDDKTLIIPNSEAGEVKWFDPKDAAKLNPMSGKAKAVLKKGKFILWQK